MPLIFEPLPTAPEKNQCEANFDSSQRNEASWQNRVEEYVRLGKDPHHCGKFATHIVEGRCLCRRHTANRVLVMLEAGLLTTTKS